MAEILLNDRLVCDLELLLSGAFKPLNGFLNKKDYQSVVKDMRLSDGSLWPMPIVLPINEETKNKIKHSTKAILKDKYNLPLAWIHINDIYKPNIEEECKNVYKTTSNNHPYVKILHDMGNVYYVGGMVEKINDISHYDFNDLRMTPDQAKILFAENNWKTVVGFQTRNPMHCSHVELTKYAMKEAGEDSKLLIQPIVGVTQDDDVDYYTRVKCYKKILKYYDPNRVKLILLPLSMRMAGPREAVWHSLIRKNYGCTHFIVGRDHAGPSSKNEKGESFYGPYDAHKLIEKYQDEIGIKIIISQMIVYDETINDYLPIDKVPEGHTILNISGTELRRKLRNHEEIPIWFTYPEVATELKNSIVSLRQRGFCVYLIGLSGSGKTTFANALESKLKEYSCRPITILDGDIVRNNLSKGLGFSKEDRSANVKRIGFVASEIVKHNGIVICSNIAPYDADRNCNRNQIEKYGTYLEVYMNTPLEICEKRDVKGLYRLARAGVVTNFTGISDPFEEPSKADITISDYTNIQKNIEIVIDKLIKLELI